MKLGSRSFYATISIVGMLLLCSVILVRYYKSNTRAYADLDIITLKVSDSNVGITKPKQSIAAEEKQTDAVSYFYFDPNTASFEDFTQLGLSPKVAKQIINYRNTGAKFRKPEDFSKIYALSNNDFLRLKPYIKISSVTEEKDTNNKNDQPRFKHEYQPKTNHPIDINRADKSTWMLQKGIGEGFANRIIAYREKLGGFISKEQLKEVYGLPDSTYQNLLPFAQVNIDDVVKININTASYEQLSQHPYIGKRLAENIIKLRNDVGKYNKIEDLRMVPLINEENYRKIAKYLIAQ